MNPRVKEAIANDDYTLTITFDNGEVKRFDVKPYLSKGIFSELKDINFFKDITVSLGTVTWKNNQDFCPDTLYEESI